MFANLLSNAVKYGAKGSPITVKTVGSEENVLVYVHNEGPPIPVALVPSLFEPMKRGADPSNNASRSVGLGLYIVKHIVDAHGGSIDVRSSAGDGTTFVMQLPRHPIGPPADHSSS